jgi:hypothetical protein
MEDGSYESYCYNHRPETEDGKNDYSRLALLEKCFHIPWRDVVKITLHKPTDVDSYDRTGPIITVEMKTAKNVDYMRGQAIEVCHGLQLMADRRATIHQWTEATEQNDCWTETNYCWEAPATCTIIDKYWGPGRIKPFHALCRTMAKVHKWELVDETLDLLTRIVNAVDDEDDNIGDNL